MSDEHNASIYEDFQINILNVVEDLDGDGIEDPYDEDDDGDGFTDERNCVSIRSAIQTQSPILLLMSCGHW